MANYYGKVRTNYFGVKDEKKFKELTSKLEAEDNILIEQNSEGKWSIASYSSIDYCLEVDNCEDYDLDAFFESMKECIADGDAMIWTEIGNENLKYFVAYSTVVTSKEIVHVVLEKCALDIAKDLLSNDDFETQMDY